MSSLELDPPRWKDRAGQSNLAERMAGRLIRAMGVAPVLSDPQIARIEAAARATPRRPVLVRWWPALAAALLVSGATFAVAARLDLVPRWLRSAPAPQAPAPSAQSHKPRLTRATPSSPSAPVQAAPTPAIENPPTATAAPPAEAAVPSRRPTPATHLALLETQPPPLAFDAVRPKGGERWLAEALHSLRSDHAPGAALALLDLHAAELGQSAFVHEAMLLRVEALLDLKRSGEALALLDGKSLSNVAAARTLLLTRAELRAAAGRYADSLADFDAVLARARRSDEQALYGRAVCRSRTGDKLGAQADLSLYQRQFPNGAHIRDVEKQLGSAVRSASPVP